MKFAEFFTLVFTFVCGISTVLMPFMGNDGRVPVKYPVAAMGSITIVYLGFWLNERAKRLDKTEVPSIAILGIGMTGMITLLGVLVYYIVTYIPAK